MDKRLLKSILLIITYAVVLVIALARLDVVLGAVRYVLGLFRPLIIGFALAFILNRPCHFFFRLYRRALGKTPAAGAARPLAVVTSYVALVLVVTGVFSFVLPKLAESIQTFILNLSGYISNVQGWLNQLADYFHLDMQTLDLSRLNQTLENLLKQALGFLSSLGPQLLEFTTGIVSLVVTGVLALVFSIYMLSGKEKLLSQCRRVLRAYVPAKIADPLTNVVHLTSDTFTRFVTGQLIEACILGGLCTVGMLFIQPDYAPLIGVTIGASAIIPVAGAYIGAMLSAVLLLMVSPLKALIFLVFLVVLQQIEGNVIYPKVVGSSIGLPGIWVLAAVTVGGGLLGLEGVLFSVPVASVLYTLLRRDVHKRLDESKSE
ncbi:MAG TPA: AI-2E family transporter [Candidatus Flavonifractor merdavium]|nr:AI-2E family transporter [Candidatus Flavonifractor merdavium]